MSDTEIITTAVILVALPAAFGLGWVAGAAHVARLRRALRVVRAELVEALLALGRVTGGTEEILAAVRADRRRAGGDR
jgi:hypothetical protein